MLRWINKPPQNGIGISLIDYDTLHIKMIKILNVHGLCSRVNLCVANFIYFKILLFCSTDELQQKLS